ncbi:sugar phosphate isomerase/epimerase family protein [Kallotenue papyrolyticum]|uniref:sugar phosphate isomerase/epimerase family protein n=1 Tax=Kallotenue papyrolyticum TaxID=1325125 RepID=UPI00046F77D9|nr:sugar phosphate isomerase/epimerase [Kallotenue papyrolyticum]
MHHTAIALQLYTVREETARDMPGTLRRLAEIGYRAVEFAGFGNADVPTLRQTLSETGLTAIGGHVPLQALETRPDAVLADLQALGCRYVVVPSVPEERRRTLADAQRLAEQLNRLAERAQQAGLIFAYHNHAFEFEPLEQASLWDVLLRDTDPAHVRFELDLFWAVYAGRDAEELLRQLSGRVPLAHIKDMSRTDRQVDMPVGEGALPWERVLPAARAAGVEWYIVEQDHPRDALNDVTRSLRQLQRLLS